MLGPFNSLMLRLLMALLRGAIQLFAVYVLLHGHYAPGGGFVAGTLFAAAMILPRLTEGVRMDLLTLSPRGAQVMSAVGILLFAAVGTASMVAGSPLLDYGALPFGDSAPERRAMGVLLIEVGVTMAVAGAMLSIYLSLAGAQGEEDGA
jgi:multicomponent Na+:H+ antiporter subunit B